MKAIFAIGAGAALAFSAPAFAGNLLKNGSFEDGIGAGTDWTVTHSVGTAPVVFTYGSPAGYPTGAFGEPIAANGVASASPDAVDKSLLYFSSDNNGYGAVDAVSQIINVIKGQTYDVGIDYYVPFNGLGNSADAQAGIAIGGNLLGSTFVKSLAGGTWFNFATTYTATATGAVSFDILFAGLGKSSSDYGADIAFDRAYVNTGAVPEPATWAMMIAGFGIAGAAMRRRKAAVSFA